MKLPDLASIKQKISNSMKLPDLASININDIKNINKDKAIDVILVALTLFIFIAIFQSQGKTIRSFKEKKEILAKDIAMHIAAEAPDFISEKDVPLNVKKKEEEVFRSQMEGKKPENIIDKILVGKMKSFYEKACLYDQKFIKDDKKTVKQILKDAGDFKILRMWRWKVGL